MSSSTSTDGSSPTASPPPLPLNVSRKKGKNWAPSEDEQLCKSWLAIAQDPIIGNEQKSNTLWERVHFHFVAALPNGSERNQTSLSNRWCQIQKSVNKFCGFFAQIEARNESAKFSRTRSETLWPFTNRSLSWRLRCFRYGRSSAMRRSGRMLWWIRKEDIRNGRRIPLQ